MKNKNKSKKEVCIICKEEVFFYQVNHNNEVICIYCILKNLK